MKKKNIFFFLVVIFVIFFGLYYFIFNKNNSSKSISDNLNDKESYSSNKLENVSYSSEDKKGNKYIINANFAEIDFNNRNILFLTNVKAIIELKNSEDIYIRSDYGKYNSENFDTIFQKM